MELELKFRTDAAGLSALAEAPTLGPFGLGALQDHADADTYYDTADQRFLRAGYACRIRERDGQPIVTVKGLGSAEGAMHRREEVESPIPAPTPDPTRWEAGPARALVEALANGAPLQPLFALQQGRRTRPVSQGGRPVATLSLDTVEVVPPGAAPVVWHEVEIELLAESDPTLLNELLAAAQPLATLTPEPRSKFARAWELLVG